MVEHRTESRAGQEEGGAWILGIIKEIQRGCELNAEEAAVGRETSS